MGIGVFSFISSGLLASLFQTAGLSENLSRNSQLISWSVQTIQTPQRLNQNDVAEIIVEGEFPSSCFSLGPIQVASPEPYMDQFVVVLNAFAYRVADNCPHSTVKFRKSVTLGHLKPGVYNILQGKHLDKALGILQVRKAGESKS